MKLFLAALCVIAGCLILFAQPSMQHRSALVMPHINKSVAVMNPLPTNSWLLLAPEGKTCVKSPMTAWPLEALIEQYRTNKSNVDILIYQ